MTSLQRATCMVIEAWVRLYTLGLSPSHRAERLDLMRADTHDQLADAPSGAGPASIALCLLGRCLRGAADDVTWRLFEARRLPHASPMGDLDFEGGPPVQAQGSHPAFVAIAAGIVWAAVLVLAIQPVAHSLAYAGALAGLIALLGWVLEARGAKDDEAAPSLWPLLLAAGVAALAGGATFAGGRLGLAVLVPLALGLTVALVRQAAPALRDAAESADESKVVTPIELARHASAGDAIAIERERRRGVSRRAVLRGSFGVGLASVFAMAGGIVVDFLWRRNVAGFGGIVVAGPAADFPPGSKTRVRQGKFWLVSLTEAQGGPGYLALWQKCPHLGCVVPWEPRFSFVDPDSGDRTEGWFRCPCHQSTYNHAGVRVFGPATRSMDRMALRITDDGLIEVDTGDISKGVEDNATFAVAPPAAEV